MTCSIPLPPRYSSTRTTSRPAPLSLPLRPPSHTSSRPLGRSHTRSGAAHRRITRLFSPPPLPRPSLPYLLAGLPGSPGPIPVVLNPSLRTRVSEIPMPPSEDCPNAHSNLVMNLALLPINLQMRCVSHSSIRPVYVRSPDPVRLSAQKSLLRPPKLAPSAWQLYFTDFIQRAQANTTKKLNVAQAAKEAGQEYANLSAAEKEVGSLSNLRFPEI